MKLKQKSSKKKVIFIASSCILAALLAVSVYAFYTARKSSEPTAKDTASLHGTDPVDALSDEEQQSYEEQKKQEATEPQDPADEPETDLVITFTSVSQNDSSVRVRAEIDALIADGSCKLTLTKDGRTITKTAVTYPMANVSTCQGFDIPTSELSPGTWNVRLNVSKENQAGHATTTVDVS